MGVDYYACELCKQVFDDCGDRMKLVLVKNYEDCLHELNICYICYPQIEKLLGPGDGNGEQVLTLEFLEWKKKRVQGKIKELQDELEHMETLKPPTLEEVIDAFDKEEEEKSKRKKRKQEESEEVETKKVKSA